MDGVVGIAAYGPGASLFTLGRNHSVQQFDVTPESTPTQVAAAQHAPANTPPTPPSMLEERKNAYGEPTRLNDSQTYYNVATNLIAYKQV